MTDGREAIAVGGSQAGLWVAAVISQVGLARHLVVQLIEDAAKIPAHRQLAVELDLAQSPGQGPRMHRHLRNDINDSRIIENVQGTRHHPMGG